MHNNNIVTNHVVFCADSPGCVRGFMSVERIRLILGQGSTSIISATSIDRRQYISPEINFTCDGMITKWIIVANSFTGENNQFFPELQVWRNVGNDTYHKISGTHIFLPFVPTSTNTLYEYSSFDPISVRAGDVLGVFTPDNSNSRIFLAFESGSNHPRLYYHQFSSTSVIESPFDVIDRMNNVPPMSSVTNYRPLVAVEFGEPVSMLS